jgi:hypothetical protein
MEKNKNSANLISFFCNEISAIEFCDTIVILLTFSRRKFEITPPIGSPPRANCISTYLPLKGKINGSYDSSISPLQIDLNYHYELFLHYQMPLKN